MAFKANLDDHVDRGNGRIATQWRDR